MKYHDFRFRLEEGESTLFAQQYHHKYASTRYPRWRHPGPGRWLVILLLCCLVLFSTLDPVGTFSRYMVNLQTMFTLNTSSFYLTPSLTASDGNLLENNQLTYDWEEGFTENIKLAVENSSGANVTTHEMLYSVSLSEAGPNPLFDLYIDDGEGGKVQCVNNAIEEDTLAGGSVNSNSHYLCFKLKDGVTLPEQGSAQVHLIVASSEPYVQSYTFRLNIQAGQPDMIEIPGTDIERPNVEIPEGEIMVFKDNKCEFLTVEDLMVQQLVVEQIVLQNEEWDNDLIYGSLYVPASVGELVVNNSNEYINWDVYGHIILEPNILVNRWKAVNMLSHAGDVILNNTTISGNNNHYEVTITAVVGNIEANEATITALNGGGQINLVAGLDINLDSAEITSAGSGGLNIQSVEGNINASNAEITSTNGAKTAAVVIQTPGHINLDGASVESNGSVAPPAPALLIESTDDGISAKSAILTSTNNGKLLKITAKGLIELDHTPVSSGGPISINTLGNINADSTTLTAASNGGLLEVLAQGFIELNQATLSSGGNINIQTLGDISAKSTNLSNTGWEMSIEITSTEGVVDIADLEVVGISQTIISCASGNIKIHASGDINAISTKMTTGHSSFLIELISSAGQINLSSSAISGVPITDITSAANIYIAAFQDIRCIASKITASTKSGKELRFESTGVNSKLYVDNATLAGSSILAVNLQIEGVPANGNIQ